MNKTRAVFVTTLILFIAITANASVIRTVQNGGSDLPSTFYSHEPARISQSAVVLGEVPTSRWTYGCSATAAGMMFGYYDRVGYSNMYTGPANGGVAPLYDLGARCSLIATRKGFDGRQTNGHVDDYWVATGDTGPDPWLSTGVEHQWGDCVADFMGTNQMKWNFFGKGYNADGSTMLWTSESNRKLHDYVQPGSYGMPRTSLTHGLRLFAESRGYAVMENYTQQIDTSYAGGFSFNDYMNEINSGAPVMLQLEGHSMLGVGYDQAGQTVYLHDTWDNEVHAMQWGGTYAGMRFFAVTVLHLEGLPMIPEPTTVMLLAVGVPMVFFKRRNG